MSIPRENELAANAMGPANAIWNLLQDGELHSMEEVMAVVNPNMTVPRETESAANAMDSAKAVAKAIWDLLQDGEPHSMEQVLAVTPYSMERSTGFGEIVKAMKDLGFVTKENKQMQFTDKVFPFGRGFQEGSSNV